MTDIQMNCFLLTLILFSSPISECELVVTNCLTGDAEYMTEKHDRQRLMDIGRASSSIPVVSPMVEIDGVPIWMAALQIRFP